MVVVFLLVMAGWVLAAVYGSDGLLVGGIDTMALDRCENI
ncbi:hypothetical protein E2C01_092583 [Portunus trituberculatus]|uniref:Uncharacterized protein n=1 Tax=Portunus trituberculatus TaxID=210409 RepID=A0A5B7JQY1_PORTR|nr:hypothetical protein [Portunus trituberculatus]